MYVEYRFAGPSRQAQLPTATPPKCGSCRAPARLRWRRHRQPLHRLNHRFRSLAEARQLPQEIGGVCGISVCRAIAPNTLSTATPPKCGSCRAPARLRWRRHRQPLHRLKHRFRSLAKARQLPQGIGGVCGIPFCRAIATSTTPDSNTAQMWELSSPSEAAKAAAQATSSAPEPPLSQPR